MDSADKADRLIAKLREEKKCYERILELAQKQKLIIEKQDSAELLKLLREKQDILNNIARFEQDIAPLRSEWPELKVKATATQVSAVESVINDIRELLGKVIAEENEAQDTLKTKQQKVSSAISKIQKGKTVNNAYSQSAKLLKNKRKFTDSQG